MGNAYVGNLLSRVKDLCVVLSCIGGHLKKPFGIFDRISGITEVYIDTTSIYCLSH